MQPDAYVPGGQKIWYAVLFVADTLIGLGVTSIPHLQTVHWYKRFFDKDGKPQKPVDHQNREISAGDMRQQCDIEGDSGLLESGMVVGNTRTRKRKRPQSSPIKLLGLGAEVYLPKARAGVGHQVLDLPAGGSSASSSEHEGPEVQPEDGDQAEDVDHGNQDSVFIAEPSVSGAAASAEVAPAPKPLDIVAAQAGQDSFDYVSSAGHKFHFVFKINKTSSTSIGQWQCTCYFHEPVALPSGNKTLCTSTRSVRSHTDHDDNLRWLQQWAEEADSVDTKDDHQKVAQRLRQAEKKPKKKNKPNKRPTHDPQQHSSWTPGQPASSSARPASSAGGTQLSSVQEAATSSAIANNNTGPDSDGESSSSSSSSSTDSSATSQSKHED